VHSFLDILYLGRIFPKRAVIMAKKELRWAPLLGQYRQSSSPHLYQRLPMPLRHDANRFNTIRLPPPFPIPPILFHFDDPQLTVTLSGAVMVDRKNSKDAVKMMHHVGEDMKRKGVSLWIFPEGTRSLRKEDEMLPFKKGAFHLAVQGEFRCQSRVRLCLRGE
jgi:lysophosphatidate acyltransferase